MNSPGALPSNWWSEHTPRRAPRWRMTKPDPARPSPIRPSYSAAGVGPAATAHAGRSRLTAIPAQVIGSARLRIVTLIGYLNGISPLGQTRAEVRRADRGRL